jgi:putative hydrolase of the HAD superfamily
MALGRDAPSLAALRRGCARAILGSLPVPVAAELSADEVVAVLLAALQFTAFPEAREALGRARAAGCRVVAVSNWDISLPEVLERVGVAPLLDAVVTSAAVGEGKPAPAIFHHALALAGTAPGDALHVGDDLDADVRGAQACGIQAILLRREPAPAATGARVPASADRDVVTIASLAELSWPERGASRRRA